jgi:SAM-dependent methyltransferase
MENMMLISFFSDFSSQIMRDSEGAVRRRTALEHYPVTMKILTSLQGQFDHLPSLSGNNKSSWHSTFVEWYDGLTNEEKTKADLNIQRPDDAVHFVPGLGNGFYDFSNSDIMVEEFLKNGIAFTGKILDFGCSSGRNVATLKRAFKDDPKIEIYGVDPAVSSIEWANKNVSDGSFHVNEQTPPLPFDNDSFDIIYAKSLWTHFGPVAARNWFDEAVRVLKPGGYLFFSTHGAHDVACRLVYNFPNPVYSRFDGHENWTKELFLQNVIDNLREMGFSFHAYKEIHPHSDLAQFETPCVKEWGLTFMTCDYVTETLLPKNLELVSYDIARTAGRHDAYIVGKV